MDKNSELKKYILQGEYFFSKFKRVTKQFESAKNPDKKMIGHFKKIMERAKKIDEYLELNQFSLLFTVIFYPVIVEFYKLLAKKRKFPELKCYCPSCNNESAISKINSPGTAKEKDNLIASSNSQRVTMTDILYFEWRTDTNCNSRKHFCTNFKCEDIGKKLWDDFQNSELLNMDELFLKKIGIESAEQLNHFNPLPCEILNMTEAKPLAQTKIANSRFFKNIRTIHGVDDLLWRNNLKKYPIQLLDGKSPLFSSPFPKNFLDFLIEAQETAIKLSPYSPMNSIPLTNFSMLLYHLETVL
jgi:hypothetical protein